MTGTRTTTRGLDGKTAVDCKAAVTTELGADPLTRLSVTMSAESMATQKSTWNLTTDGRLTGADITTTVDPTAGLAVGLKAGAVVLGAAGPALLAAGPPGWIALAGAVGVAGVGAGVLAQTGALGITGVKWTDAEGEDRTPPPDSPPGDWDVSKLYVSTHGREAQALANLRCALASGAEAHARAAMAAATAESSDEQDYWSTRVTQLQRLLAMTAAGAARAEARYAAWTATQVVATTENFDFRFRLDHVPTQAGLEEWAGSTSRRLGYPDWAVSLERLHTAVSLDLEPLNGDNGVGRDMEYEKSESDRVHYRPPRSAVLRVWEAKPAEKKSGARYVLRLVDTRRVQVSYPGNETSIQIQTGLDSTNAVAVTFDDAGALTKVSSEIKDPTLQRASSVSGLIDAVGASVTLGKDLREALSPPSLVDQAAEAKAAAELGLTETPEDPLKKLKDQVAEQQLRAQLALAEQLQKASSTPVFVSVGL